MTLTTSRIYRRSTFAWLGLPAIALALLCAALGAFIPAVTSAQTFGDRQMVTVVEVPVTVYADGEPVRGLTVDDFELIDQRQQQDITDFEVVDLTRSGLELLAAEDLTVSLPLSARRHLLFLFDLSFASPAAITRSRLAAKEVTETSLHPTDLVAVGTYSVTQGTRLLLGFTSDRQQVQTALETLGTPQLATRRFDPLGLVFGELRSEVFARDQAGLPIGDGGVTGESLIEQHLADLGRFQQVSDRKFQESQIQAFSRSFSDFGKMMRGIAGRKQVILLSEGFDSSLFLGTTDPNRIRDINRLAEGTISRTLIDSDERFGSTRLATDLQDMVTELQRADCTIQAIDVGGLRAGGSATRQLAEDGQSSLFWLADETGGEFIRNYNDLGKALGETLDRTRFTYLLAFEPQNLAADGSFHKLRVRLKNGPKGARVVHRPGYFAPLPFAEQEAPAKAFSAAQMIVGGAGGGTIDSSALLIPFPAGERAYVPLILEIDGQSFLAGQTQGETAVEIYAYAFDRHGTLHDHLAQRIPLDAGQAAEQLQQTGFKFYGDLELAPGRYLIRTLVRNGRTGDTSLRSVALEVPSGEHTGLTPVVAAAGSSWVMIREQRPADQPGPGYPFLAGEASFIPSAAPLFVSGREAELLLLLQGKLRSVDLRGRILASDGSEIRQVELSVADRAAGAWPGLETVTTRFDPGVLAAGDYVLEVELDDPATGAAATGSLGFRIES